MTGIVLDPGDTREEQNILPVLRLKQCSREAGSRCHVVITALSLSLKYVLWKWHRALTGPKGLELTGKSGSSRWSVIDCSGTQNR